ncbi:MAG TPA: AbrB/MazE/SpoVT family DNA-binding domain-containing protein [Planctomycetota bacterium]|nr:AbrB/MazE/SpoVT family DNA-binding domain-containing protein [Planctomycetota bacterium]
MVKKLTKHGNSLALVIDRPILDLLGITADTPLEVKTDGRKLVIEAAQDEAHKERVREATARAMEQFGDMLKRLADR